MNIRRYQNLVAVKTDSNQVWGFHAHNLEVFEFSQEAWSALESELTLTANTAVLDELDSINHASSSETTDATLNDADGNFTLRELSLNIAQICNLKCTYCAAGGDGSYGSNVIKLDLRQARKQIQYFISKCKASSFNIRFLGGEPLLYPDVIRELCQYAKLLTLGKSIQITFAVTTNGTLITSRVADLLAEFNFAVTASIDGAPAINDRSRPVKNKSTASSTELTLRGLSELRRVRTQLRALNANSVFGSHNLDVLETYNFLKEVITDWDNLNFIYSNNDKDDDNNAKYIASLSKVGQLAYRTGGLSELIRIQQFAVPLSRIAAQTRHHSYCGAGKTLLQSDTRGDLYSCNWFMNDPAETVGSGIKVNEQALANYQPTLIELNNCEKCWARHLCGGGCMAFNKNKTGDKHNKDLHFCARTRAAAAAAISYYGDYYKNL